MYQTDLNGYKSMESFASRHSPLYQLPLRQLFTRWGTIGFITSVTYSLTSPLQSTESDRLKERQRMERKRRDGDRRRDQLWLTKSWGELFPKFKVSQAFFLLSWLFSFLLLLWLLSFFSFWLLSSWFVSFSFHFPTPEKESSNIYNGTLCCWEYRLAFCWNDLHVHKKEATKTFFFHQEMKWKSNQEKGRNEMEIQPGKRRKWNGNPAWKRKDENSVSVVFGFKKIV